MIEQREHDLTRLDSLSRDRAELRQRLVDELRDIPGAVGLIEFGADAKGTADGYSDIDFQLLTTDLGDSLCERHAVLGTVRPVLVEWCMMSDASAWASTVMFASTSPYHKLDIGFQQVADDGNWPVQEGNVRLWTQLSRHVPVLPTFSIDTPIAPELGSAEHFVTEQFLSVTRYVKARRRGRDLTCWRFASALAHSVLALRYSCERADATFTRRLTTEEFIALDSMISAPERSRLLHGFDFSASRVMDTAVREMLLELAMLLARLPGTNIMPPPVLDHFMAFVTGELGLEDVSNGSS